jgi:hypothetical protein
VKVPFQVQPPPASDGAPPPPVEYRWDPDTEILSAQLTPRASGKGMSGSVEVEGADGSWLILEVSSGNISGVEVAVWPEVQRRTALKPPGKVEEAHVLVSSRKSQPEVASLEVETALMAEADETESVFHFTLGRPRQIRTIRLARDLLLDLDASNNLAGVWLLNVPPFQARV